MDPQRPNYDAKTMNERMSLSLMAAGGIRGCAVFAGSALLLVTSAAFSSSSSS